MKTLTRIAAVATGAAVTAGVLAFSPASAQNVPAGGIEIWGATAASFPQADGPYKAFSNYGGTDTFVIGLDDKLVALPGVRAGLAVPSDPAAPAGNVAGTTVRSVYAGHVQAAWAVTADGALHKWGGARGSVIPDNTWTASQLGGEAVEVVGGGSSATVRLKNGRAVMVDAFGVSPCAEAGQPLTGVKRVGSYDALLLDGGRLVSVDTVCNATTAVPAGSDPVVDVSANYATTASGKVLQYKVAGTPDATFLPTDFEGKAVRAVQASSTYSALLTDRGEIVVWRHSDGGAVAPAFNVPAGLAGRAAVDLQTAGSGLAVLYADVANQAKPTISGPARVDSTLTASEGDWLGAPTSLSYQWLLGADDSEIAGADGATFTPTANELGKTLKVRVTATRGDQVVSATSNATAAVAEPGAALEATSKPSIAGTAKVGQTLTGKPAVFNDDAATLKNQWLANGAPIAGAAGTSLKLAAAQVGKKITFRTTATLGTETAESVSDPTAAVAAAKVNAALRVSATSGQYGRSARVTVRVSASGKSTSGTVTLRGAGATQRKSVSGGAATFVLPRSLAPRRYAISAAYSGNGAVNPRTATGRLAIAKGNTSKPTFKAKKKPTSKKKGKAVVAVKTPSGLVKASGKVTITLKKGKSTKKVKATVKKGKVTIKLPKLKKGTYKVKVVYNGNGYYKAAASKTYKLKVKK